MGCMGLEPDVVEVSAPFVISIEGVIRNLTTRNFPDASLKHRQILRLVPHAFLLRCRSVDSPLPAEPVYGIHRLQLTLPKRLGLPHRSQQSLCMPSTGSSSPIQRVLAASPPPNCAGGRVIERGGCLPNSEAPAESGALDSLQFWLAVDIDHA